MSNELKVPATNAHLSATVPPETPKTSTQPLWKIHHFDLSQAVPALEPLRFQKGLYAVFWWQQIPLGHLEITASQLPLSPHQLVNRLLPVITPTVGSYVLKQGFAAPLPGAFGNWIQPQGQIPSCAEIAAVAQPLIYLQKQQQAAVATQAQQSISLIICTHNRPKQLAHCLRSLNSLASQPNEIIVVDNAPSSEATRSLVAQFPNIRYILEAKVGLSVARNTGLRAATGDLIAFTDDDVAVHPHWINGIRAAFAQPNVMAMTGLILPAKLDSEPEEVFQRGTTGFGWGYRPLSFDRLFFEEMKPFGVPVWRIGAGANMAFRRDVFTQLGGFDERLGAGASGCSEDSELWYRILAAGWCCQYEPSAVVFHHHREDFTSLNQQMYAYMRGHTVALWIQAVRHRHWGNLRRIFIALPRYYIRQLFLGLVFQFRGKYRTTLSEIRGYLSGTAFYIRCAKHLANLETNHISNSCIQNGYTQNKK